MYGFELFYARQKPDQTYQGRNLYLWVNIENDVLSGRYRLLTSDGAVEYVATMLEDGTAKESIEVTALPSSSGLRRENLCAQLTKKEVEQGYWGSTNRHTKERFWDTKIGPGIDPCLIIGLAAVIDG